MTTDDVTTAERLAHRRANISRLLAVMLLLGQATALHHSGSMRAVDIVHDIGWVLWIAVVLAFVGLGGAIRRPALRALLNDESTIEHRRRAFSLGFWVALVSCGGLWIAALRTPVETIEALRLVITLSVAVALLRFATLEKRSLRGE